MRRDASQNTRIQNGMRMVIRYYQCVVVYSPKQHSSTAPILPAPKFKDVPYYFIRREIELFSFLSFLLRFNGFLPRYPGDLIQSRCRLLQS